jgi:chloramphenicol 3-O-phosphotransferase
VNEPFLWLDNDSFIDATTSEKFFNHYNVLLRHEMPILHDIVKVLSDKGLNVLYESAFDKLACMEKCVELLHEYPVLFVHVTCPLEELRRREIKRGDRDIGMAEAIIPLLNPKDNTYDIVVDTHKNSKEECTDMIIDMLNDTEKFTAFKTLWSQRTL